MSEDTPRPAPSSPVPDLPGSPGVPPARRRRAWPWVLGVLVALVKLSSIASVLPGPALWAFMALTVVLTAVLAFDPRGFWEMAEKKLDDTAPPRPADGPASASASSTSERAT